MQQKLLFFIINEYFEIRSTKASINLERLHQKLIKCSVKSLKLQARFNEEIPTLSRQRLITVP